MKQYNNICLLVVLLLLSSFAVKAAGPDAEYRKLSKTYMLHADGSQEYNYAMELTLFTHTAMNRTYGESFVVYNPLYQEVKINTSYTRQKDGTIVETPENAFVEVLPRKAANAPAYNHLKELVIVHTGLELGATIYLDYSVITKPGYLPELDLFEEVLQSSPVREFSVSITVPENKPLYYTLQGVNGTPQTETNNGKKTIVWKLRNLPAASLEPVVSVANGDIPFLAVSTYSSEEDALKELYKQFSRSDDCLKSFAEMLTKNAVSKEEKVTAVLNYVNTQLDSSPLHLSETGFRIRSLEEVMQSAYGTEAEKANLLYSLLKVLGYDVHLKVSYQTQANPGSLGLSAIKEFIIEDTQGSYILSALHTKVPASFLYQELLPIRALSLNGEKSELTQLEGSGIADFVITLSSCSKATVEIAEGRELIYKEYPFNRDDLSKNTRTLSLASPSEGYYLLNLPQSSCDISKRGYQGYNSKRTKTLTLPYQVNEQHTYRIIPVEGVDILLNESINKLSNRAGEMSFVVEKSGTEIVIKRTLQLYSKKITPNLYNDFRSLITAWSDENNRIVLLKAKE